MTIRRAPARPLADTFRTFSCPTVCFELNQNYYSAFTPTVHTQSGTQPVVAREHDAVNAVVEACSPST